MGANDQLSRGAASHERVNLRGRAIEHGDGITMAFHVQHQVFAHHGQANQSDVGGFAQSGHGIESWMNSGTPKRAVGSEPTCHSTICRSAVHAEHWHPLNGLWHRDMDDMIGLEASDFHFY